MQATISLAQLELRDGDRAGNLAVARQAVIEAGRRGSDLVVLPELWLQGYALDRSRELALEADDPLWLDLSSLAAEARCAIAGGLMAWDRGAPRNRLVVHGRDGKLLAHYDKLHLFGAGEAGAFEAGQDVAVVDLGWCRAGLAICYDLRFPELFRALVRKGAEIVLLAAQWPLTRKEHWRTLVRARAIENQVYVAACTRTGFEESIRYSGGSMLVDPWGDVVVEAGAGPVLLTATVDMGRVREIREKFPVWRDVRPEIYGGPANPAPA